MSRFALEPIYESILVALVAVAAVVAVIVLFTPRTPVVGQRRTLIVLRSVAGAALLFAILRPSLIRTDNEPAEATLVVAVDKSRSMTFPDGDGSDRWTSQTSAWRELATGLVKLDQGLSVRLLTYDSEAQVSADVSPSALDELSPDGDSTDLSVAARAAISIAGGQPIAGFILMGDGAQTAAVKEDGARRVASTLNSLGVPLWSVPIGPAGGTTASRDVAIEALDESLSLFAGNEVNVDFRVQLRGLAGVEVPIDVAWIGEDGKADTVASRTVVAEKANDEAALTIPLIVPAPGTYRLVVKARQQSGEWVTQNNQQIAFVDVREGGGRILYLEGMPRLEQTFLRRSLGGFPDLDLTYRWIPSDINRIAADSSLAGAGRVSGVLRPSRVTWPADLGDWFEPGKFDIYIIGDLDADALGNDQLAELADSVSSGAALVMLGGYRTYGPGGYEQSPLSKVLPIRMDGSSRGSFDPQEIDRARGQIPGPISIRVTRSHPITELGGDASTSAWQRLSPLDGANQWSGPKVAPGVQALLESQEAAPLLVVGEYGRGRVATLAIDSTWRWWRTGNSEIHRRFWRQVMLWLLSREETSADAIQVELDSRRFSVANAPEFRASLQTLGNESDPTTLVAEIIGDAGEATTIPIADVIASASSSAKAASMKGRIPKLDPGFYKLRVRASESSSSIQPTDLAFQVIDESRELDRPLADPVYLRQLASLTSDHGGAAFAPDEMDALLKTIADRRVQAEIPIIEKHRLGDGPITGWLLFLVFAGALSVEWLLRRRWGLA